MTSPGCFVVGTGRCGSTTLSRVLSDHSQILSLSEFFTVLGGQEAFTPEWLDGAELWQRMATPQRDVVAMLTSAIELPEIIGGPGLRPELRATLAPIQLVPLPQLGAQLLFDELALFTQRLCGAPLRQQYDAVFGWLQARLQRSAWVERSGASLDYLAALLRHWPQAKFVHIARDGAACAMSMSKHPFFRVKLARLLHRDSQLPVADCLAMDLPLERFGALWSAQMIHGERLLSRVPAERVLRLRLEHVLRDPARKLMQLIHFIDPELQVASHWLTRALATISQHRGAERRPELASFELQQSCRPGMRLLENFES